MKRYLFLIILLIMCVPAFAETMIGESLSDISETGENNEFPVKVMKTVRFKSGLVFEKNSVLNMEIVKIVGARHFRRNAYIVAKPVGLDFCLLNLEGEDKNLEAETLGFKPVSKSSLKKAGINTGIKTVNTLLPGSEQILQISKGLIIPEEGKTRIQSAAGNFTDSLPTKYFKKGENLNIKAGDKVILKFYHKKDFNETELNPENSLDETIDKYN